MSRPDQYRERQPLEIEKLLTADQRRTVSNGDFQAWRESIAAPARAFDEIDLDAELDELTVVDPYECHAPSRRSDKELGEFLNLLDSLETGIDRKETTR